MILKKFGDKLQVEFFDPKADFKQFYDTTRLIINKKPLIMSDKEVYNCLVSWYGSDDCQIFNENLGKFESLRATEYRNILAQIDLNLLQNDPDYCKMVMQNLLNRERVEKYLDMGLEEMPERPCGKYIGGVMEFGNQYKKFFSEAVGKASHNSETMINKRKRHRERIEYAKKMAIDRKKAEIAKLQSEIDDLSR